MKLFGNKYRSTPFCCGSCGEDLDFMSPGPLVIPGAYYVHSSNHKYHCYGRLFGKNTHTAPLRTKWEKQK